MLRLAPLDDDVMEVGGAKPKGALLKEFLCNAAAFLEQRRLQLEDLRERVLFVFRLDKSRTRLFLVFMRNNGMRTMTTGGVTPSVDIQSCLRLEGERSVMN